MTNEISHGVEFKSPQLLLFIYQHPCPKIKSYTKLTIKHYIPMAAHITQSHPLQLQDRVAIVTGGSGGIGKAISLHLPSLGAKLVINDISSSNQSDLVVSEINTKFASLSQSPRAVFIKADISDPIQVKNLFDEAESAFNSPLYIFVNVAGILDSFNSSIADSSLDNLDRTFTVNTRGAYLCCKEAANRLKQGGNIMQNIYIKIIHNLFLILFSCLKFKTTN
ncbi:putative short-chain dehydrogenase/reductase SDR, NAD(P)-binding domain superfamily [Helianthus anomalus]